MENISIGWLITAGAIIGTLLVSLFAFLKLTLAKEKMLSDLRQEWMDGLRQDIAAYTAAMYAIEYLDGVYRNEGLSKVEFAKTIGEPYLQVKTSFTRIMLRLNSDDPSNIQKPLITELNKMRDLFQKAEYGDAVDCVQKVRQITQQVLKAEWERIKKGEPTFRWFRRIALAILLSATAFGAYFPIMAQLDSSLHIEGSTVSTKQEADLSKQAPETKDAKNPGGDSTK